MAWPTPQDYNEAVQNPRLSFIDPDLRAGQPELNSLGLPRPIAGGFACVYKIQSSGNLWAARCFLTEVTDQQQRYDAISKHLGDAKLPHTVPFTYLPSGIKVQGKAYPLLKMAWVQGESLGAFVGKNFNNSATLRALADKWVKMVAVIQSAGISHGDLQHGNILVVGGDLRLIDYDGMFVPSLRGRASRELGHRNYQHPARTEYDYDRQLDNFSAWVIWLSLLALSTHPELWNRHRGGDECLLFRREDFLDPTNSKVLRDLNSSSNSQIRALTQLFISLQNFSPLDVPSLDGRQTPIAGAPIPLQSGVNWWEDHVRTVRKVEETPADSTTNQEAGVVVPDVSWILDSTESRQAIVRLRFKNSLATPRLVLAGSLTLTFLLAFLAQMPAFVTMVATFGVLGLNLLFCYSRYRSDPSVAEKCAFKRGVVAFMQQIRQQQAIIDSIVAERSQILERLANTEADIAAEAAKLQAVLQAELSQAQAKLSFELQALDQKRRNCISDEARDLQQIQQTLGNQIATLDRKVVTLSQNETTEKDNALKVLQKAFIENYLRGFRIGAARIRGIGPALVTRMAMQGITTAAEAQKWTVLRVSGIGHFKAEAIQDWRDRLEAEARRRAPSSLSRLEIANIENKYAQERQLLLTEKQRLQTQHDSQVAAIRQSAALVRQGLAQDDQRVRSAIDKETTSSRHLHEAEQAALKRKLDSAKQQAAPIMNELSDKLRSAQKQTFALHWQAAKNDRESQRFSLLGFDDYAKSLVGL